MTETGRDTSGLVLLFIASIIITSPPGPPAQIGVASQTEFVETRRHSHRNQQDCMNAATTSHAHGPATSHAFDTHLIASSHATSCSAQPPSEQRRVGRRVGELEQTFRLRISSPSEQKSILRQRRRVGSIPRRRTVSSARPRRGARADGTRLRTSSRPLRIGPPRVSMGSRT